MTTIESVYVRVANTADVPDGIHLPPKIAALVDQHDTAVDLWDAARLKRAETWEQLQHADDADEQALTDALKAGEPDPGTANRDRLSRQYVVETKHQEMLVRDVDKLTDDIREAVRADAHAVLTVALEADLAAHDKWRAAVQAASDALDEANRQSSGIGNAAEWAGWMTGADVPHERIRHITNNITADALIEGSRVRRTLAYALDSIKRTTETKEATK